MKNFLTVLAIYLLLTSQVYSDIIPDGSKRIGYEFTFDNLNSFTEYVFVVYPVNISNGTPMYELYVPEHGKDYYCSGRFGTPVVYGFEREKFEISSLEKFKNKETNEWEKYNDQLISYLNENGFIAGEINTVSLAPRISKYTNVKDVFSFGKIGENLTVQLKERQYYDENDNLLKVESKDEISDTFDSSFDVLNIMIFLSALSFISILLILLKRRGQVK